MIELIETLYKEDGTKEETKKQFSSKSAFIALLKKSNLIPASLIFELVQYNKVSFVVGELKRDMQIKDLEEKNDKKESLIISPHEPAKPFTGLIL